MPQKPAITIVGPGNLGSVMARALHAAGYRIDEIVFHRPRSRQRAHALARASAAQAASLRGARFAADMVWLCVPDGAIAACAAELSRRDWKGKTVLHASGALPSGVLDALRRRGAAVASLHPMMTFVRGARPELAGVTFAVEGDAPALRVARRIASDLGGHVIRIDARHKPLYHAFGAFTSPLLIATLAAAEQVARAAGIREKDARRAARPILQQTLRNYLAHGPAAAFSGPLVRGDLETIARHLEALRPLPDARAVYRELAAFALRTLPVKNRRKIGELLREAK